jgi:hypothetical protein
MTVMAETCTERSYNNRPIRRDAQDAAKLGGETLKAMRTSPADLA